MNTETEVQGSCLYRNYTLLRVNFNRAVRTYKYKPKSSNCNKNTLAPKSQQSSRSDPGNAPGARLPA